ncbi:conjugal transfer protein TraF [Orientia tsutsugamushi]|nr:conjugal transfer protein TraF [Orientia tsutsugamushi]
MQKQIMEKAHKFATMWQLATLLDYQLINAHEPSNSLHRKLYQEKSEQKNDSKLKTLLKTGDNFTS